MLYFNTLIAFSLAQTLWKSSFFNIYSLFHFSWRLRFWFWLFIVFWRLWIIFIRVKPIRSLLFGSILFLLACIFHTSYILLLFWFRSRFALILLWFLEFFLWAVLFPLYPFYLHTVFRGSYADFILFRIFLLIRSIFWDNHWGNLIEFFKCARFAWRIAFGSPFLFF